MYREETAREGRLDLAGRSEMLLQMGEIGVLAGGVDDQQEVIARAGDHQIVEDAAGIVGELGVALLTGSQARDVAGDQRLERLGGVLPRLGGQPHLTHVRDIEQPGGGARLRMLGEDAGRVLHRHLVASERHQTRAELAMQRVERCAFEWSCSGFGQYGLQSRVAWRKVRATRDPLCPET